jgi:hypothetical protein
MESVVCQAAKMFVKEGDEVIERIAITFGGLAEKAGDIRAGFVSHSTTRLGANRVAGQEIREPGWLIDG